MGSQPLELDGVGLPIPMIPTIDYGAMKAPRSETSLVKYSLHFVSDKFGKLTPHSGIQ